MGYLWDTLSLVITILYIPVGWGGGCYTHTRTVELHPLVAFLPAAATPYPLLAVLFFPNANQIVPRTPFVQRGLSPPSSKLTLASPRTFTHSMRSIATNLPFFPLHQFNYW